MAVKERSQIKGTDAQIKAFAGHNGVLAFATDTKSLHVLSGTAGTTTEFLPSNKVATKTELANYTPTASLATVATSGSYNDLSDKPVVDSALSATSTNPVQNKVINSALDVKLSTSGGTMTGDILLNASIGRIFKADKNGSLAISGGNVDSSGGAGSAILWLGGGDDSSGFNGPGIFSLEASKGTWGQSGFSSCDLQGTPDGSLRWGGHEVARVISSGKSADGTQWYRKYNDGYIEQAGLFDNGSDSRGIVATITFLAPFSSSVCSVQVTPGATQDTLWYGNVIVQHLTTTSVVISYWGNAETIRTRYLYWFACGY